MKRWLLALGFLVGPALAGAGTWSQVLLFDWVYPGESNYQLLKSAASQAGNAGWLSERFNRDEKIPQASARELAGQLWDDEKLDAATRAKLKEAFKDETEQLDLGQDRLQKLSVALDDSSRKLDDLEASMERNRYGKGSTPAVNLEMYSGYRLDAPAGMVFNDTHGYMVGGLNITLLGTYDKANYSLSLGQRYFYGADSNPDNFSTRQGSAGAGASFQLPLGEGGLEVHLGDTVDLFLSSLLFSTVFPKDRDAFYVDVTQAYRPIKNAKAMDLSYPAFTKQARGLFIRRQGAEWYWPFTNTQFLYAPENDFFEVYRRHLTYLDLRLDEDFSGIWGPLEGAKLFYLYQQSGNDQDELRQGNYLAGANATRIEKVTAHGVGYDFRLSLGTQLFGEAAMSHYKAKTFSATLGEDYNDLAWFGTLSQPLGPLQLAVETGMAGPRFLSGPRFRDRIQPGATFDSMGVGLFPAAPGAPAYPNNAQWVTVINDPGVLNNNNRRLVVKAEYHASFVSIGLYDGMTNQIEPTTSLVEMTPYIEGHDYNGFGWFKVFGYTYADPPAPLSVGVPSNVNYALPAFNRPTDARAVYNDAGNSINVHWQSFSQLGYKTAQFNVLLSRKGVGDPRVLDDSTKALNYAGANLQFDLASVFGRELPLDLGVFAEVRDLARETGMPVLDASNLFNQQVGVACLTMVMNSELTLLAMGGYETWRSDQSFFPVNMQVRELGAGFDLKLDPIVSGLQINTRATQMNFDDLNIASREMSLWTLSVGSTLSY